MSPGAEDWRSHRLRDTGPYLRYNISLVLGAACLLGLILTAFLSILLL
jgi:hypothetical protein